VQPEIRSELSRHADALPVSKGQEVMRSIAISVARCMEELEKGKEAVIGRDGAQSGLGRQQGLQDPGRDGAQSGLGRQQELQRQEGLQGQGLQEQSEQLEGGTHLGKEQNDYQQQHQQQQRVARQSIQGSTQQQQQSPRLVSEQLSSQGSGHEQASQQELFSGGSQQDAEGQQLKRQKLGDQQAPQDQQDSHQQDSSSSANSRSEWLCSCDTAAYALFLMLHPYVAAEDGMLARWAMYTTGSVGNSSHVPYFIPKQIPEQIHVSQKYMHARHSVPDMYQLRTPSPRHQRLPTSHLYMVLLCNL
jgi:hypothetical protein